MKHGKSVAQISRPRQNRGDGQLYPRGAGAQLCAVLRSKMVADLEAEWGMTLLERSKRGVCLTSAGEQVLPFLRKVLNDHAEL